MKIKDLSASPLEEVIECFLTAFEGYFVRLPEDVEYWRSRFMVARVDWNLSFGIFEGNQLLGYIINGIDHHNGILTAYNTGTGVIPGYRGKAIVDQLYAHAFPLLKDRGVEKCLLEVICENERAIKVYRRVGFNVTRHLRTFIGKLPKTEIQKDLQKCHFSQLVNSGIYKAENYSWDNSAEALKMSQDFQSYCLGDADAPEAYLVLDRAENIIQLESRNKEYSELFAAAGNLVGEVKLKNVDFERSELIKELQKLHFSNSVNQFEMEMWL